MAAQRQPLSRERIARVALELLDAAGPNGLAMRSIAARLGVRAPSLYHHVSGAEDVLAMVHDLVDAEIDLTTLEAADWRQGLIAFANSYRDAFRRHPHLMPLVASASSMSGNAMAVYEALAAMLGRIGLPSSQVPHYMGLIDNAVVGALLNDFTSGIQLGNGVRIESFPEIRAILRAHDLDEVNEGAFRASIALIVDDIAWALAADARATRNGRAGRTAVTPRSGARPSSSRRTAAGAADQEESPSPRRRRDEPRA